MQKDVFAYKQIMWYRVDYRLHVMHHFSLDDIILAQICRVILVPYLYTLYMAFSIGLLACWTVYCIYACLCMRPLQINFPLG